MTLKLQATPEEIMRAVEELQAFGGELGLDAKVMFGLSLALEECGSNIVNHALLRDPSRAFFVSFEHADDGMTIELRDDGPAFDPTAAPDRAPSPEDDDEPPGGWGIQLVRRYTDRIEYLRENGENILRLFKRLDRSRNPAFILP